MHERPEVQKFTKAEAQYKDRAPEPAFRSCGLCRHYIEAKPDRCAIVQGAIAGKGGCALFVRLPGDDRPLSR